MTKVCATCSIEKPFLEFTKAKESKDGLRRICRSCAVTYYRARRQKNPEYYRAYNAQWVARNPGKHREYGRARYRRLTPEQREAKIAVGNAWKKRNLHVGENSRLKRCYGITLEDFEALAKAQSGRCLICKLAPLRLCVDHCHTTGKVRGLLCRNCNSALGLFQESRENLSEAILHLDKHA